MGFEEDKDPAGPPITEFSDRDYNNAERGIKLFAIAQGAEEFAKEGHSPLEVQTYINTARRELAAQNPDTGSMNKAFAVVNRYKAMKEKPGPGEPMFNP